MPELANESGLAAVFDVITDNSSITMILIIDLSYGNERVSFEVDVPDIVFDASAAYGRDFLCLSSGSLEYDYFLFIIYIIYIATVGLDYIGFIHIFNL